MRQRRDQRQPLLDDLLGKGVPGNDSLNGDARVAARLLGVDQSLADAPIPPMAVMYLPDAKTVADASS